MKNILFYSGEGNHHLGAAIIRFLGEYFGKILSFSHIDIAFFPDLESDDKIPRYEEITGKVVVFYQSIFNISLLEQALEHIWAIKKQYKAMRVIAVIPFLIFRRQDHEEKMEEILRLKMVIDRLKHAGVDEIITVSPHSPNMRKYCEEFGITMWEVDPSPLFASTIKTYLTETPIIYSPDLGSICRAISLAKLTGSQVIFSLKERGLNNEAQIKPEEEKEISAIINRYKNEGFSEIYYADEEHIKGQAIVMVEDETSTGGTANKTGLRLKALGAKFIISLAIHAVLVPGWRRKLFDKQPIDKVIFADTITREYDKRTGGLIHDISVAESVAQTLYKCLKPWLQS